MSGVDKFSCCQVLWARRVGASVFCLTHNRKLAGPLPRRSILKTVKTLSPDDLTEIERAGRRCAVCRSGRRWREFAVVRPADGQPVVMCAACRVRYGDVPPAPPARPRSEASPASTSEPGPTATTSARRAQKGEDRVKRVLRELPKGEHTTGSIAKAAGLNHEKTLRRLRQLAESGDIRQVGKRWTTEPPPTDLHEALDRLQAHTSNIRFVRDESLTS